MGLLDFLSSDDARLGIGLLAAGGYQPTKMTSAQRIAQALQGESSRKKEEANALLLNAQLDQLKAETEFKRQQQPLLLSELELKNARHKRLGNIAGGLLGEFPESGVATPSAGAGEASAPSQGGAMTGFGGNFERELRFAQALALEDPASGKAQIEILKMKYPDLGEHQGILFNKRTGQPVSTMPFGTAAGNVIQYQPLPGGGYGVTTPSGSADVLRSQKRIDAEEGARVKPHERGPLFPGGHPISTNQLEASQGFPNLQPPAIAPPPTTAPPAPSAAGNRSFPATSADAYRRTPEYAALTPQERANFDMVAAREQLGQVTTTDQNIGPRRTTPQIAVLPRSAMPANAAGMTPLEGIDLKARESANMEASKEFISEMRQNYSKLRDVPSQFENLEKAKQLAIGNATQFMGPLGKTKLEITKFMRANVPFMNDINTDGVTSAEQLQTSLFAQVIENLKKLDAQPSQEQQRTLQAALGTLSSDPQSIPKMLDVFKDILTTRVAIHNRTVESAEERGTKFPHDIRIELPKVEAVTTTTPATPGSSKIRKYNPKTGKIE